MERPSRGRPERTPLNRERIVTAAVAVADRGGITAVSMRNVGKELGVEAMSLYHHIANKEDLLDALSEWLFERIENPRPDEEWRPGMVRRADSARAVLGAHPWGLGLMESRRAPGPALLAHHDSVLGCLRENGFSIALAGHAFSVLDAYTFGFVMSEVTIPLQPDVDAADLVAEMDMPLAEHPYLAEFVAHQINGGGYAFGDEFRHGLELVLAGLEQRLATDSD